MPELPEVETVVRGIRPAVTGRTITGVPRASQLMARSTVGPFAKKLLGRRIERLDRHGKWMFFRLSGEDTLVVHLGMTGHLAVIPRAEPLAPHTHLRLGLDGGAEELRFDDARRFGELFLCDPASWTSRFGPDKLGPEALQITVSQWTRVLEKTSRRLKAILLDQRAVAGIGNIYADEILFEAGLSPLRLGRQVTAEEVTRLSQATRRVLRRAIRGNGSTIRDYVTAAGAPGEFQARLRVYGRGNQPCRVCGERIELDRGVLTGRATCWCPTCQR